MVVLYQKLHLEAFLGQSYATFSVLSEHTHRVCFYIDHIGIRYFEPDDYNFRGQKMLSHGGSPSLFFLVLYNRYKDYSVKF